MPDGTDSAPPDSIRPHSAAYAAARALDARDPLASQRARFDLPEGRIYLDGNSLGALPKGVAARLQRAIEVEWGQGLIQSWLGAGWYEAPRRVGARLAPVLGCGEDEVRVTDGTSVNFFKLLAAALHLRPDRRCVLTESEGFPTDLYLAQSTVEWMRGEHRVVRAPIAELPARLDSDGAVLALSHVDFRTGALRDLAGLTHAAHAAGALVLVDVSHSVGALPLDLAATGVDLAVGCGYKHLCGGPGAPAFAYVRRDLHADLAQPLSGWFGHARPFAFELDYEPAAGLDRILCGTPPILSMLALEAALEIFEGLDLGEVRRKGIALSELLITECLSRCAPLGLELASPRHAALRASQVSFRHPHAYAIVQALIARGIVGDFREPDLARFGLAPLYLRYVDMVEAAIALEQILRSRIWQAPEYQARSAVT